MSDNLTTIECSGPGDPYGLLAGGPSFYVHLAGPGERGGTGPCLCGFDRFGPGIGFSVGGGFSGPGYQHHPCAECLALADGRRISGTHAGLFADSTVRTWRHRRQGLITGVIIGGDDTWAKIRLHGDHRLSYMSESNRGRIDEDGDVLTVRREFLTEVTK